MEEGTGDVVPHASLEASQELGRGLWQRWNVWDHLSRDAERGTVQELGRRGVRILSPCGPDSQQNYGQFVHPGRVYQPCLQCPFEVSVESFHDSIGLGMVHCGCLICDPQGSVELVPQGARKLSPSVRHQLVRDPKPGNPMPEERPGAGGGTGVSEGDCLRPPGEPVNDREEVRLSL